MKLLLLGLEKIKILRSTEVLKIDLIKNTPNIGTLYQSVYKNVYKQDLTFHQ